jgi:DNA repair protein RadD
LVIDEAHHAVASTWLRILDALPEAHVLGTTATPQKLDGRGLSDIFDELVIGPSTAELIEQGYLSRFTTYAPSRAPDLSRVHTRMGDYAIDELADRMSGVVSLQTLLMNMRGAALAPPRSRFASTSSTARWLLPRLPPATFALPMSTGQPHATSAAG